MHVPAMLIVLAGTLLPNPELIGRIVFTLLDRGDLVKTGIPTGNSHAITYLSLVNGALTRIEGYHPQDE